MKFTNFKFYFLFGIILILNLHCTKDKAKVDLTGTYNCSVHIYSESGGVTTIDSNYFEKVNIVLDGYDLNILKYWIHIDSLSNEKRYYKSFTHGYLDIQFKNDSIYYEMRDGGQGGYGIITYIGKRQK